MQHCRETPSFIYVINFDCHIKTTESKERHPPEPITPIEVKYSSQLFIFFFCFLEFFISRAQSLVKFKVIIISDLYTLYWVERFMWEIMVLMLTQFFHCSVSTLQLLLTMELPIIMPHKETKLCQRLKLILYQT